MASQDVFVGIDVACASGKRLPLCIVSHGHPLMPLEIPKELAVLVPRGLGNRQIASANPFREHAKAVVSALQEIAWKLRWEVHPRQMLL